MNSRKILSLMLAILTVCTLCLPLALPAAAEEAVVSATSPAITATVGDSIDLSDYSVTFPSGVKSNVSWTRNGSSVTSVECTEKGVIALVAKSGNETANVYVVVKAENDTDYELFYTDFSDYSSLADLQADGFTAVGHSAVAFNSDGLVLGNLNVEIARLVLPGWLADFGDYSITANLKMLTTANTSRWCSVAYRMQNNGGKYYPYYHMCIRENTTGSSGIEFAERTPANAWNVMLTTSGDIASMKDDWHEITVAAYGSDVQYSIDGTEELYITSATSYSKGQVALIMNYGTLNVSDIRITVQETKPARPERKLNLSNPAHAETNLINNTGNVVTVDYSETDALLGSDDCPGNILIDLGDTVASAADLAEDLKAFREKNVIVGYLIKTEEQAANVANACKGSGNNDVSVVSANADALIKARTARPILRAGLIVDLDKDSLTDAEANEIRESVNLARASFAVVDVENVNKSVLLQLQELAVAVWVNVGSEPSTVDIAKALTAGANAVVSGDGNAVADCFTSLFAENTMTRTPIIIGHRGNPSQAPENSILGAITAYENGADVVEIDVRFTKDKEIIVLHDDTLDRTTTGKGTAYNMTLAQIKEYFLLDRSNKVTEEKVPTMREFLEAVKDYEDLMIFVEIKGGDAGVATESAKLVAEMGMEDRVDFISFSSIFLKNVQTALPGASTGYLLSGGVSSTIEDALEVLYTHLASAQSCDSTINVGSGAVSKYFLAATADRGITVWPWTYTASNNNVAFITCADGITTDDCQWAKNMYKYISCGDITLAPSETASVAVNGVTYGGEEKSIGSNLVITVIDGDAVTVDGTKLTAVKEGSATVLVGFKTKTTGSSEYVLYADPVTVTVQAEEVSEPVSDGDTDSAGDASIPFWVWIIVAVAALSLAGAVVYRAKRN